MAKAAGGAKDLRGLRGQVGRRGVQGQTGATGATGPAGPTGAQLNRGDVIAMVADQFADIRKEMSLQLSRMAQIQVQLDQIHTMVKKLLKTEL